jgi:hypothetical protein
MGAGVTRARLLGGAVAVSVAASDEDGMMRPGPLEKECVHAAEASSPRNTARAMFAAWRLSIAATRAERF